MIVNLSGISNSEPERSSELALEIERKHVLTYTPELGPLAPGFGLIQGCFFTFLKEILKKRSELGHFSTKNVRRVVIFCGACFRREFRTIPREFARFGTVSSCFLKETTQKRPDVGVFLRKTSGPCANTRNDRSRPHIRPEISGFLGFYTVLQCKIPKKPPDGAQKRSELKLRTHSAHTSGISYVYVHICPGLGHFLKVSLRKPEETFRFSTKNVRT